jgi:teichuronic acid biosynthesis glycosyltransferase TuaG
MGCRQTGVSVVMPAYNAGKTLLRAMESVLSQDHGLLELLVIDDCSQDDTAALAQSLAQRDSRVRLLRNQQNGGVSFSRRRGVEAAAYDYIAFLDSDDYWEPEKLTRQLKALEAHPEASLCFTGSAFIDDRGNRSDYVLNVPETLTFQQLLKQNVISCSSVLVRRELMLAHPMVDDRDIHEDYAAWLRILRQIPYALGIDEPLLVYQISTGSKSGNKLKAARMQWRTYRVAGVPLPTAAVSFCAYAVRNLQKYRRIKDGYGRNPAK